MRKIVLLSTIICLVSFNQAFSQKKPSVSKEQIQNHKESYAKKAAELGISIRPDFFYKYKINLNKVDEFKSVGLDIVEMGNKVGYYNYMESTLISPFIIEGTIIEKEYETDKKYYFHTTYTIRIENILKSGIQLPNEIHLKLRSGMIGKDYIQNSGDPQIFIGEKVLLMLGKVDFDEFNQAKEMGIFDYEINASDEDFVLYNKFSLKNEIYFDEERNKIGNKNEVDQKIQKIKEINSETKFFKTKF